MSATKRIRQLDEARLEANILHSHLTRAASLLANKNADNTQADFPMRLAQNSLDKITDLLREASTK